jgi:predicted membrane protein
MVKKAGVKLMGIFIFLFVGLNLFTYYSKKNSASTMSGMFVSNLPVGINMSLIAFILQWVILLMIVIFAYSKFLKHRKEEEEKILNFVIPKPKSEGETNIDVFYKLLKDKKSLTSTTISKAFNITKEQAIDWAKILEEHGLVTIEYPAFADPEFRIVEELKEDFEMDKLKEISKNKNQEED